MRLASNVSAIAILLYKTHHLGDNCSGYFCEVLESQYSEEDH